MIGPFLKAWVLSQPAVTAILGAGAACRFYAGTAPMTAAFPRGVYQEISDEDISDELDGPGNIWLAEYQLQFSDKGAGAYERLKALKLAIVGTKAAPKLHHYAGGTLGGVTVNTALLVNSIDNITPPEEASAATIYERWLDFRFWYARG